MVDIWALYIIALESAVASQGDLAVVLISLFDALRDDGLPPELNATTVPMNQYRRLVEAMVKQFERAKTAFLLLVWRQYQPYGTHLRPLALRHQLHLVVDVVPTLHRDRWFFVG
jgi:hypothetical protein